HPDGLDRRRIDLRHPRHWPLSGERRVQPRLHAGHGRRAVLRRLPDDAQPARRHRLQLARSARGAEVSAAPALRDRVAAGNGAALETNGAPAASLWSDAMKRVRRNRAAVASLIFLVVVALLATLAPW